MRSGGDVNRSSVTGHFWRIDRSRASYSSVVVRRLPASAANNHHPYVMCCVGLYECLQNVSIQTKREWRFCFAYAAPVDILLLHPFLDCTSIRTINTHIRSDIMTTATDTHPKPLGSLSVRWRRLLLLRLLRCLRPYFCGSLINNYPIE